VFEIRVCTRGPNPRRDYWGGIIQIPVCKRMSHLNFPPKLGANSIFKPRPAGWNRCARQPAKHIDACAWLRTLYTRLLYTCI